MLISDSRERKNAHILDYFNRHNIEYEVKKLDTADYWNSENPDVLVDRKKDLSECATNMCSPDSSRFWKELRRAHSEKKKLIILVEHGPNIKSLQDVHSWKSKYSTITGSRLQSEMYRIANAYRD